MIVTAQKPVSPVQDIHTLMHIDIPMDTPAARRAMYSGLLEAKKQAMQKAAWLARLGTPLLVAVIAVSFVHVWESIGVYRPGWVPELKLPETVYHATGAFFTLGIDAAAYYCVAAANVAQLAGARIGRRWGVWFFLALTFLLNAAFVLRYAPDIPQAARDWGLPGLDLAFVFMLPAFIPVAIVAIEKAAHLAEAARLKLLVETTALTELTAPAPARPTVGPKPQNGLQSEMGVNPQIVGGEGVGVAGGNRTRYLVTDLIEATTPDTSYSRGELKGLLGCSDTTIDRLLVQAIDSGAVVKVAPGTYQRVTGDAPEAPTPEPQTLNPELVA